MHIFCVYIPRICFSSVGIGFFTFVTWSVPFVIAYIAVRIISIGLQFALPRSYIDVVQPVERPVHATVGCGK